MDENLIGHVAVGLTRGARSGGVRGGQQLAERPAPMAPSIIRRARCCAQPQRGVIGVGPAAS